MDRLVHLNQIQVVGSHNSYHLLATQDERDLRRALHRRRGGRPRVRPRPARRCSSPAQEVRQIELDVFDDPDGGLYADPLIRAGDRRRPAPADAWTSAGMKVLHVQDVDYHSNCLTLKTCLRSVKGWSDAHRGHAPIAILLELKDTPLDIGDIDFVDPPPFDEAALDRLDAEIRSVFPANRMITPDDVRGARATLEEAVLEDGWPTLGQSRGKVIFLMDNGDPYRTRYLAGHPSLRGRVLFTNAEPGQPDAAFLKRNDAIATPRPTSRRSSSRATWCAPGPTPTPSRPAPTTPPIRRAALRSGAQWVSTDYPPTAPARCSRRRTT